LKKKSVVTKKVGAPLKEKKSKKQIFQSSSNFQPSRGSPSQENRVWNGPKASCGSLDTFGPGLVSEIQKLLAG